MDIPAGTIIRRLHSVDDAQIEGLADLLIDSIDGGASVSFMHPLVPAKAQAFWRDVAAGVAAGERALLVAEDESGIVSTVQPLHTTVRGLGQYQASDGPLNSWIVLPPSTTIPCPVM